jgi:hypothetical protein
LRWLRWTWSSRPLLLLAGLLVPVLAATPGGPLPGPLPLLPADNWWNQDVSAAPLDPDSAAFIRFIGSTRALHPDFGGEESPGSTAIYGMPYIVVNASQTKRGVVFDYADESDGVDHGTGLSYPFYPIPDEAITQPHWIEGGYPGNENVGGDRHMLIVDSDNKYLYELFSVRYSGGQWFAGSGAFFDLNVNGRRPDGWTSADAAGLAILPGLVRYDEVYGPDEIRHAFRFTVRATNGYVWPASHRAGSTAGALPMGARLRLKASKDLSAFDPFMQKIFRAMKNYGLIVADNGSDMFITGTFDNRWDNDVLNPAFGALRADDFEVVQLGWQPSPAPMPTFADVPLGHPYYDDIEWLYQNGYTAGCAVEPLRYCPDQTMNRAESSVFVERGIHSASYDPPTPSSQVFGDLGLDSWAAKWVNGLWLDDYTSGCGTNPLMYCPWQGHTRAEGAVFYLRMLRGASYEPPQPTEQTFADVPLGAWYARWAQAAYEADLITTCQTTPEMKFCPEDPLSRGLAASMMYRAKMWTPTAPPPTPTPPPATPTSTPPPATPT